MSSIFGGNIVGGQLRPDRMISRHIEHGGHLPLLQPLAHQSLIAPPTQGQRKSVEQDRLAGTGFPGEHGKTIGKIDIEPVDQHDVADGKSGEHVFRALVGHSSCPALYREFTPYGFASSKT